ncbi:hypothetical protein Bca52824_069339 [Brassica carinata]|uniref:Uncharacterized protein n=1 Tax=Brassica carinata TaxID=52824 RepID=A0A8X7U0Y3_BRACI|nr:hypothetical protein Bca52824_069339 [Brassica carinata]
MKLHLTECEASKTARNEEKRVRLTEPVELFQQPAIKQINPEKSCQKANAIVRTERSGQGKFLRPEPNPKADLRRAATFLSQLRHDSKRLGNRLRLATGDQI